MKRCPKCKSENILLGSIKLLETFEEEHNYSCSDCQHTWQVYADMSDADDIREMKLMLAMQQEERGDY